jgi:hypothetical protein
MHQTETIDTNVYLGINPQRESCLGRDVNNDGRRHMDRYTVDTIANVLNTKAVHSRANVLS